MQNHPITTSHNDDENDYIVRLFMFIGLCRYNVRLRRIWKTLTIDL